ncbi:protein phosphatase 1 regulatory subunit 15A-like [Spea bombifrons]|uniref:protein phosphatase 1 regulatory subunit 15A-like n=1 Tax=Spea bombifrons TaxID=233779 RepID=UPI00234BD046|nr:protein phosphatase 1 regulatory subunit 15A-like [Spea bombifrons]
MMTSYSDSYINMINTVLKMSLYLTFGSYSRNFTLPVIGWHKGTAFQMDNLGHLWVPGIHTQLDTDMVLLTTAATITQSLVSLAKNIMRKRAWLWKLSAWMTNLYRRALWWCWRVPDSLLVARRVFTDNYSQSQLLRHKDVNMNSTTYIKYDSECVMELIDVPSECSEEPQDMDLLVAEDDFMDQTVNKEPVLTSCTNTLILSMICLPSEEEDCTSMSEFMSDQPSTSEDEDMSTKNEEHSNTEDGSVDSGVRELLTPGARDEMDSDEESNWSEDSWDTEDNLDWDTEGSELWASFCKNDDPYNPLSFSMPIESSTVAKATDDSVYEGPEGDWKEKNGDHSKSQEGAHGDTKNDTKSDESPQKSGKVQKVRFSPVVSVHRMITWDYAYRAARKGPWEEYARDRCRFKKRITEAQAAFGFCLEPQHREKMWARLCELAPDYYEDETLR